jgi:hypothetical protein
MLGLFNSPDGCFPYFRSLLDNFFVPLRLAVEAELRLADWRELGEAQQAAAEAGRTEDSLTWDLYELHVTSKVRFRSKA